MLRKLSLITALTVPLIALAVEIQPADFYDDVRSSSPEAAGINLLTRAGIVQGYGNRVFGTTRLVNRAEFLKIAMLAAPEENRPLLTTDESCFPDVTSDQWFATYVCAAKNADVVKGNPDGLFHPERTVQYDEALKMLTLLFKYQVGTSSSADWGEPYYEAAAGRGTDLPIRITLGSELTRAETARLTAAFIAENEGQLTQFRLAESGEYQTSSSSSSSVMSSESSVSSSVSSMSSSSSSVASQLFMLPPLSHFLVTGMTSDAIASGIIHPTGESAQVSLVQVKLFQEVRSIEKLEVLTVDGQLIATLLRRITTDIPDYKQTFDAIVQPENRITLPADTDTTLVLRAVVRSADNAGFSEELLQVRSFNVTYVGISSNQAINYPLTGPFPKHQTSFGRMTSVSRASPVTGVLASGTGMTLSSFAFSGTVHATHALALTQLTFTLQKTGNVTLSNIMIRNAETGVESSCSLNLQAMTIFCPNLSQATGKMKTGIPLVLDVLANITVPSGSTDTSVQIDLRNAGSPENIGAVEWTDTSGSFRWIESTATPLARGTRLQ